MAGSDIYCMGYWGLHFARHAPGLLVDAGCIAAGRGMGRRSVEPKILIATHHKVLTVFLGRVFRTFGALTGRTVSRGRGAQLDYARTILIDHHSEFDLSAMPASAVGLHVVRDPRDLLVSATFYHCRAREPWLHVPRQDFGGQTYQQRIKALDTLEARLLFELDHSAGDNIADMLAWQPVHPGIAEMRYNDLVGAGAHAAFGALVGAWPLTPQEQDILSRIFRYFSIGQPGMRGNTHIRDPQPGQWRNHFTPAVAEAFDARFPDAVAQLGYEDV